MAQADYRAILELQDKAYQAGMAAAVKSNTEFKRSVGGMEKDLAKFAGKLGLTLSALDLVASAIKYNVNTAKGFEKSLSQLRSLTGVNTDELKKYSEEAIRLGGSSTQTASQVVDAFKLIGSQKPELLQSRQALVAVTESAITLAEAASIEVPEAAAALTSALNQFGMSGDEARRVINALAAGSQKGAGDINYLNMAITKAGTAASVAGMSFEETVGVIEILAERIPDASQAGTNLRNILIALSTKASEEFNPKIVGMQQALKNLAESEMDAAAQVKLFGKENYNAAQILLQNIDRIGSMTEAVTGTNTATEQARINTDNLSGSIAALSSKWEEFNLQLNSSNGILRSLVDEATDLITCLQRIIGMDPDVAKFTREIGDAARENWKAGMSRIYNLDDMDIEQKIAMAKRYVDEVTGRTWDNIREKYRKGDLSNKEFNQALESVRAARKMLYEEIEKEYSSSSAPTVGTSVVVKTTYKEDIKLAKADWESAKTLLNALLKDQNATSEQIADARKAVSDALEKYNTLVYGQKTAPSTKNTTKTTVKVEPVFTVDAERLKEVEGNIAYYKKQLEDATVTEAVEINKSIALWEGKAKAIRDAGKAQEEKKETKSNDPVFRAEATQLKDIQENVQYYRNLLQDATADTATGINEQISYWQKLADAITDAGQAQAKFSGFDAFTEGYGAIRGSVDSLVRLGEVVEGDASAWEKFTSVMDAGITIVSSMNTLIELMSALSEANTASKAGETLAVTANAEANTAAAEANSAAAVTAVANALANEAAAQVNTAAAGQETIANKAAANSFNELAAAQIFAAHAHIPYVGVPLATGFVAQMEATLMGLKGLQMFAEGGVIGGHSYYGDKLLIRANSGETIFNEKQQRNLLKQLEGNVVPVPVVVSGTLRGDGRSLLATISNERNIAAKSGRKG